MHILLGTPEQQQLRAMTTYAGAPQGARHRSAVLEEACSWLGKVPGDTLTLEITVQANDLGLLLAMEDRHGCDPYRLEPVSEHRLWNQMRLLKVGPEVRDQVARRVLETSAVDLDMAGALAMEAASHDNPELLGALLDRFPQPEFFTGILSKPAVVNSTAFMGCAGRIEALLMAHRPAMEACRCLAQRHCDNPRGLALLAKVDLLCTLEEDYLPPGRSDMSRRVFAKISSAHGRLALMQALPAIRDILAVPAQETKRLLEAAL